jgi:ATP-binding cassette subfamily B protein
MSKILNTLFFISAISFTQFTFANSSSFSQDERVKRTSSRALNKALEFFAAELQLFDWEKRFITARANGESQEVIDSLKTIGDVIIKFGKNALKEFKESTFNHNDPNTRRDAAVFYVTDRLFKSLGFHLSLNEKYDLFEGLTKKTEHKFGTFIEFPDTLKSKSFIDSSVILFSDRISLNWQGFSRNQYIRLHFLVRENIDIVNSRYFPISYQSKENNCGPTCLKMICDYQGRFLPVEVFEKYSEMSENGTSMKRMIKACDSIGLKAAYHEVDFEGFKALKDFPCVVRWLDSHFVVVYHLDDKHVWIADPDLGCRRFTVTNFCGHWLYDGLYPLKAGGVMTVKATVGFHK